MLVDDMRLWWISCHRKMFQSVNQLSQLTPCLVHHKTSKHALIQLNPVLTAPIITLCVVSSDKEVKGVIQHGVNDSTLRCLQGQGGFLRADQFIGNISKVCLRRLSFNDLF